MGQRDRVANGRDGRVVEAVAGEKIVSDLREGQEEEDWRSPPAAPVIGQMIEHICADYELESAGSAPALTPC